MALHLNSLIRHLSTVRPMQQREHRRIVDLFFFHRSGTCIVPHVMPSSRERSYWQLKSKMVHYFRSTDPKLDAILNILRLEVCATMFSSRCHLSFIALKIRSFSKETFRLMVCPKCAWLHLTTVVINNGSSSLQFLFEWIVLSFSRLYEGVVLSLWAIHWFR